MNRVMMRAGWRCLLWVGLALAFPVGLMAAGAVAQVGAQADAIAGKEISGPGRPPFQPGDCVVFREGGEGFLLKEPTYWLKGKVVSLVLERRTAGLCPELGKPFSRYSPDDWQRMVPAMPCVTRDEDVREVEVWRTRVALEEWETPWANRHGTAGWLYQGKFLGQVLERGGIIEMQAGWLASCSVSG